MLIELNQGWILFHPVIFSANINSFDNGIYSQFYLDIKSHLNQIIGTIIGMP